MARKKQPIENRRLPHVALLVESSRTYGRGILRGIARYAHVHGPWSFFTMERDLHGGVPPILTTWKGDGIIARIENRGMAAKLSRLGCPVIDVLGQAALPGVPSFDTDADAVAQMAVDFFLKAGFQHFAYVGYPGIPFSDKRRVAVARFLQEHGHSLQVLPDAAKGGEPKHIQAVEREGISAEGMIARWLQQQARPLALLACNDVRAQQVLNACREFRIRVPEDVAVIGVDNDDVLCNLCDPPLSSIEPDTERMGYEAAAVLDRMMSRQNRGPAFTSIPPLRFVERTSTDVIAIDDPVMVQAVRFIRNEVGKGIAVKDLLAHVDRSRTDMERRFRRWLGESIHAEIQRRRLDRVRSLLRETDMNLAQVAASAGFATSAHLCRIFKQVFHQTPTEYRARSNPAA
jgi:LacI family transcriptional regulator